MKKIIMLLCIILLIPVFNCRADGLDTLIEAGRAQAEMKRQYEEETRTFESVRKAIVSGAIKKGQGKDYIRSKYGEGVVVVKEPDKKCERWVYKPESSSFFKGVKATLIFTEDGVLDEAVVEER